MGKVDRDLEAVLDFCTNFRLIFLEPTEKSAEELMRLASSIHSELNGTQFASKSEERVIDLARRIKQAVDTGEARIRELEKKTRDYIEEGKEFTR